MSRYVLFDLDGTLTDPVEGITNAIRYALERFGIYPASREELYPYIGPPLTDAFVRYNGMTPEEAQRALSYYREYFAEKGLFENRVYDGVPSLLDRLRDKGYTLMVATSKPEEYTHRILHHFGLDGYFAFVGGNTLEETRPTKESVVAYIRENHPDMTGENAVMVGDRKYDVAGAHANGLPAVGVLYGYGSAAELQEAGAEQTAANLSETETAIEKCLGGCPAT